MSAHPRVSMITPPRVSLRSLVRAVRELYEYGDLFFTLSAHRIKVRYKQSILGLAWAVVQPLSLMAIYTVIFSVITKMPSKGVPYALFVFVALLPWIYFSTGVTASSNSLVGHQNLISKVFFPREILPITYVIAALFDLFIGFLIFLCMMAFYQAALSWHAVWIVPILIGETIFTLGLSCFLAALQVRFRDIGLALPLIMQLGMFASPVVYPLSSVPARYRDWYTLNPLAIYIDGFRSSLVEHHAPDGMLMMKAFAISLLVLLAGYVFLKHQEATIADRI
jgi:lipopolysaccharide transport system permease protein